MSEEHSSVGVIRMRFWGLAAVDTPTLSAQVCVTHVRGARAP